MTKDKRKRGRPRKGEELNKGKPRATKEVTRTIKRSIKALANCDLLVETRTDHNRIKVARAYAELLLDNRYSFPSDPQIAEHTGFAIDTVRRIRREIIANVREGKQHRDMLDTYKPILIAHITRMALANHPTALKIAADMCNLTDNAPIQTETNTNTTIYKIVPTFPNSEKDVPEDPGVV